MADFLLIGSVLLAMMSTRPEAFLHGRWTPEDAMRLYGVAEWGRGYFAVNDAGRVTVHPDRDGRAPDQMVSSAGAANGQAKRYVELLDIVEGLRERGLTTPVLLRFSDILAHRLRELRRAFDGAIKTHEYEGSYTCVYPVKVNQQAHVVHEIRDLGDELGFGLEAGSKPELVAVLGMTAGRDQMPIICNGFKDEEFLETVVLATKLGRKIVPVIEKFSELTTLCDVAERYGVRPTIGVRVKLGARGAGRWESSAGARSKFGLFISEVIDAVELLRQRGMLDCLKLLHCHIGSQVYDIRQVKNAVAELGHIYAELVRLGAPMGMLDIGGWMGVDYEFRQTATDASINYSVEEYASDVVWRIKNVMDAKGVAHPDIIAESGRAMVAYSSVLVMDVVGSATFDRPVDVEKIRKLIEDETGEESPPPQPLVDMLNAFEELNDRNLVEVYHDAMQARDEAMNLFNMGYMSLPARAATERLFWAIGKRLIERGRAVGGRAGRGELPEEFNALPDLLSDIYFCNFSLFQSMPDSWAIDQLFPILPIHRLNEQPMRLGVLADITCDSDGKVDRFIAKRAEKHTLELHDLRNGEPYYLGVFLLGAYQEILGDLHNLLGDTHAVHVSIDENGVWSIDEIVEGDTVREVLEYVQFDAQQLTRQVRLDIERAVRTKRLTVAEGNSLMRFYEQGLAGYTYLE